MMAPRDAIRAALSKLADVYGEDPRSELMRALYAYADGPVDIEPGDLKLVATLHAGGAFEVHDQHGRKVDGVTSVACFIDPQTGKQLMQIAL